MFFQSETALTFFSALECVKTFYVATQNTHVMGYIQREPGMIKGWFSRRAIVIGGPVIAENASEDEITDLLKKLRKITKNAIYTEIRCETDYSAYKRLFELCGFIYQPHLNVKIKCDSIEAAWQRMDENRRRQIRRSEESSVNIRFASSVEDVKAFYVLLKAHYKNKVKKPLFPWEFFEKMYTSRVGRYLLAYSGSDVIGGMLQVSDKQTVYDYYACGLDSQYQAESPSAAIYWCTIKNAVAENIVTFDTMGAGTPDVPYGVRDFKLRFGGDLVEYGRYLHVNNKLLYKIGKMYFIVKRILGNVMNSQLK